VTPRNYDELAWGGWRAPNTLGILLHLCVSTKIILFIALFNDSYNTMYIPEIRTFINSRTLIRWASAANSIGCVEKSANERI